MSPMFSSNVQDLNDMQTQIQIVFENNGTNLIHQADPQPPGNTFAQLVCYLLLLTY